MARYNDKKDVKKIKILSGVLGALLSVTIAGSVVLGVGFGKYGKDTNAWFKPGTSISQPDTPDTPDTPDIPDTPDTPDVPEVKKSTPLEVGDRIALWEGAEGKNLYLNTDKEVWKEFYGEYKDLDRNENLFFPFFAAVGSDATGSDFATLEGNKQLIGMYFANSDGSAICLQFATYNLIVGFSKDDNGDVVVTFDNNLVDEDGLIDLSKYAPDSSYDFSIEYVGYEGYVIDSETGERIKDDNGNDATLEMLPSLVKSSEFQLVYTTYDWMNKLFSTTPFVK